MPDIRAGVMIDDADPEWQAALAKQIRVPVEVMTAAQGESATVVICAFSDEMRDPRADDVLTTCAGCALAIRHRAHAPKTPPKMCAYCGQLMLGVFSDDATTLAPLSDRELATAMLDGLKWYAAQRRGQPFAGFMPDFVVRLLQTTRAARLRASTAEARLREYEQLTMVVVRGEHGEAVEVPATPENIRQALDQAADAVRARPLDDYHEDEGSVLWWKLPVEEPPYVGSPLDSDWPGYHTHWTPLPPCPAEPVEGETNG